MIIKRLTILSIVLFSFISTFAAGNSNKEMPAVFVSDSLVKDTVKTISRKTIRRKKVIAVILAVTVGPFGIHRLYYGTDKRVPIIYSLTLGAFGILPLADIIAILTSRDIETYFNNKAVVMWMKRKEN